MHNLLPNTNWQFWSSLNETMTAMAREGSGPQAPITCSSSTGGNNPTFYSSNTEELVEGAIGYFYNAPSIAALTLAPARVISVVPNVSFTVKLPFNQVLPSSTPTVFVPLGIGEYQGNNGCGPDGWFKSPTLIMWADDFSENACPGALRTLGMRKTTNDPEILYFSVPIDDLKRFCGRNISFGAFIRQKTQQGTGTWQLKIIDDSGELGLLTQGAGAAYVNPNEYYGGFECIILDAHFEMSLTHVTFAVELNGMAGDIYYLARPAATFGDLQEDQMQQNGEEFLLCNNHVNAPVFLGRPLVFPNTPIAGTSLYGFEGLDLECLTWGQIHSSIKTITVNLEITSSTPGAYFGMSKTPVYPQTTFGPNNKIQIGDRMTPNQDELALGAGGKFTIYTDKPSTSFSNITIDLYNPRLAA